MYPVLYLVFSIITLGTAQIDPSCDFYEVIALGQEYFIYNPEYPRNGTKSCRWSGQSPQGTVIVLSCNDVDLPYSTNCKGARLSFSPTGDENLQDVENYCGSTTFTAYTNGNQLAIGFYPGGGKGGKFVCSLAAMRPAQDGCTCGFKSEKKIVGGQDTKPNEYPFMTGLINALNREVFCGASLVSNRYAVTAAHCLLNILVTNLGLLVGDWDLTTGSDTNEAQLYQIQSMVRHPSYDPATQQNDIGIVKTKKDIQFNVAVSPVCLPFIYNEYNFLNEVVTALGWGYKDFSGDKADTLQKVDLPIISNAQCDAALTEPIVSTEICTYAKGKDSCISDSGGPLVWQDSYSRKLELVGIISFGFACASNKPAVNTRVTAYLSWIASVSSGMIS